jgi:hypothetical protein
MKLSIRAVRSCFILFASVFVFLSQTQSQENTWSVIRLAGDTLAVRAFDQSKSDSLEVRRGLLIDRIPIDSIGMLVRMGKPAFEKGATMGAVVGAISGVIFGIAAVADRHPSHINNSAIASYAGVGEGASDAWTIISATFIGGGAGVLVGGLIGAAAGKSGAYDMTTKTTEEKVQLLRSLTPNRERMLQQVSSDSKNIDSTLRIF